MTEILRVDLDEGEGQEGFSIRLLQKFGQIDPYLTPNKIQQIWIEYSKHDVLFSDYTKGEVEPFLDMLFSPRAVIAEIHRLSDSSVTGLLMLTKVIPRFDALGHFAIWDRKVKGKEPLIWEMMRLWMDEFDLHRLSVETPGFGKGLIRMIERLGFVHEGTRREGTIHKGAWVGLEMYGITRAELDLKLQEA